MGAGNSVTVRDLHVFANEPAEPIPAQNAHTGHLSRRMRTPGGRVLPQRSVRAMLVIVIEILAEN